MNSPWTGRTELEEVTRIVDLAIEEDTGRGDVTSESLFSGDSVSDAVVLSREEGIIAGIPVFILVYDRLSDNVDCQSRIREGEPVRSGQELVALKGPTEVLLRGERTALNFLQRLSGIATRTKRFVERTANHGITVLDTRKTTPGLRLFERYAVRAGGGMNHRYDLSEMILIKENHIAAAGGISAALEKISAEGIGDKKIEVEVKDLEELEEVLRFHVDRIMLDNFSPGDVMFAVDVVERNRKDQRRPEIEVSGGIREDNIEMYCLEGVDFISIGSLTHSVRSLDISMVLRGE